MLQKGNINDPLDLLQPVYEEIAKVPLPRQAANILKNAKEKGGVTIRKTVGRRMKKRKHDLEDRDEVQNRLYIYLILCLTFNQKL